MRYPTFSNLDNGGGIEAFTARESASTRFGVRSTVAAKFGNAGFNGG